MIFWDSSALVHLLIDQGRSDQVFNILKNDPYQLVWWGTTLECHSSIARLEKEGVMSEPLSRQVQVRLKSLASTWIEVLPSDQLKNLSVKFPYLYQLRAGDAAQLAAAIIGFSNQPHGQRFLSFDLRLCRAAQREGFELVVSEAYS